MQVAQVMFCEIRGRYQANGRDLLEKSTDWLEVAQVGELSQVVKKLEDLGQTFEEQFPTLSGRVLEKARDLHHRETVYRETEDKLIEMVREYRALIAD